MMNKTVLYIFFSFLLIIASCKKEDKQNQNKKIKLKVAVINNPRFPALTNKQISELLKQTSKLSKYYYNMDINVTDIDKIKINNFFKEYYPIFFTDDNFRNEILTTTAGSQFTLANSFIYSFKNETFTKIQDAVKNQLTSEDIPFDLSSKQKIFIQLSKKHIEELSHIKSIKNNDNKPLILNDFYNEFAAWGYIIYMQDKYDFIITNQLLASIERSGASIHSSFRGGVPNGAAYLSKGKYGGTILLSTFPVTSELEYFRNKRGENYNIETQIKILTYLSLHEISHLFLYRDHYYSHPGCITRPTPGYKYQDWINEIEKNGPCKKHHFESLKYFYKND